MGTTANALARALHLLATHPEEQDRLRDEVKFASSDGDMTYDKLESLPFLDAFCREASRLSVFVAAPSIQLLMPSSSDIHL
jgi:cytochrome P450